MRLKSDYYRCAPPTAIIIIIDMFIIVIATIIIITIITIIIIIDKDIIIATLIVYLLVIMIYIDVIYCQRRYLSQGKANARMIRRSRRFFEILLCIPPAVAKAIHNNRSSV